MSVVAEIFVILPAAGCGLRMGLDKPKQYSKILNKPIICYTAEAFVSLPWVKKVVIVTAPKCITLMSEILSLISSDCNEKLMVIEGGDTRHKSICLGLKSIKAFKPQIVVIHDGVRPFVPQDMLISVAAAAQDYGAAGIMCPLVSTVIAADENKFLDHALDRNKYRASEMPQAFQYSVISGAYSKCSQYDMDCGTECLHLVQKYMNKKVKLIDSGIDLWKITHKKDLYAAEGIIKEKRRVAIIDKSEASEFLQTLKDALCKRFCNVTQVEEDLEYFPLIAKVYYNDTIADIIEKENILQYPKPSTQFRVVAYITFNGIADNENFWQLQSKVRKIAEQTKRKLLAVYFITTNSGKSKELYKEVSEMASSLMFDCNINLSGQIFCL